MPTQASPAPNASAASGDTIARGSGRSRVRSISASASRSRYMLSAFDAATSSAVPINVMIVRQCAISPGASHSPPRKVITTIPVMRGLPRRTMLANHSRRKRPGTAVGSARSDDQHLRREQRGGDGQVRLDRRQVEEAGDGADAERDLHDDQQRARRPPARAGRAARRRGAAS